MKEQAITGLSIGIVKNGRILITKGYGWANAEQNVKASGKTVYKIASLSKQFIGVAIMQLTQENKISLDDPISNYYPDVPQTWKAITVRHLLHHTSGVPVEPPGFDGTKNIADSIYIRNAFKDTLAYPVDSKFEYSNFGYFVLADIIRKASNMSFERYMQKNIFDKLGLKNTTSTNSFGSVRNSATGYVKDEQGTRRAPALVAMRPSGAFISCVNDMLQYEIAMQRGRLLTHESWQKVFTDTIRTPLSMDSEPIYYAYGWMTNKTPQGQLAHHGGSLPGFKSVYFRFPHEKMAIIVLTNTDDADAYQLAFGIADILHR